MFNYCLKKTGGRLLINFAFLVLLAIIVSPAAANAQAPTFVCLGECPEITPPPGAAAQQTTAAPAAANTASTPTPTIFSQVQNPVSPTPACQPVGVQHKAVKTKISKHNTKNTAKPAGNSEMNGLLNKLIQLIEQLIKLIEQLIKGGGGANLNGAIKVNNQAAQNANTGQQTNQAQQANNAPAPTLPPCPTEAPAAVPQNADGNTMQNAAVPAQANPAIATNAAGQNATSAAHLVAGGAQCQGEAPEAAKSAGLTKLAFCEDFSDPSRIDFDGNPVDGKTTFTMLRDGNIFTIQEEDKSSFEFTPQGTLIGNSKYSNYQADFISTWPTGGGAYKGFAVSKNTTGWYVESRVKHNTASLNSGFFAFWSMGTCKIYSSEPNCLEPDFYEYIGNSMIHAIHWYPAGGSNVNRRSTQCSAAPNSDRTQFFTTGVLYGPGNEYIRWYDNEKQTCAKTRSEYPQMADMAGQDYPIIFGSGPSQPYEIDYVRVWVKP